MGGAWDGGCGRAVWLGYASAGDCASEFVLVSGVRVLGKVLRWGLGQPVSASAGCAGDCVFVSGVDGAGKLAYGGLGQTYVYDGVGGG
jgi:hypothetical protein